MRHADAARVYLTRVGLSSRTSRAGTSRSTPWPGRRGPGAPLARRRPRAARDPRASRGARARHRGLAWTATMSDAIHARAAQCLALGVGRVLAPRRRRRPPGLRRGDRAAALARHTRLNRPTAPDLEVAGDLVSVVDRGPDADAIELALLRADSGQPVRRIRPGCAQSTPALDTTQAEHAGERVVLALGRAGIASCFEAWDVRRGARALADAAPAARRRIDEAACPGTWPSAESRTWGRRSLGPSGKREVWALALDTGRLRLFAGAEGYETRVLDAARRRLLLRATASAVRCGTSSGRWTSRRVRCCGSGPSRPPAAPAALDGRGRSGGRGASSALDRPNRLATRRSTSGPAGARGADRRGRGRELGRDAWTDEAAWLTIASPYRVAFGAGTWRASGRGRASPTARTSAGRSSARDEKASRCAAAPAVVPACRSPGRLLPGPAGDRAEPDRRHDRRARPGRGPGGDAYRRPDPLRDRGPGRGADREELATAGPGTLVTIPAGTPHHVRSTGAVPLFFLTVYAPPEY